MSNSRGSACAPARYPIHWLRASYYDRKKLQHEMHRVFDICHGCRRCVNLCNAFPTLFNLIDHSPTGEVDSVDPNNFMQVADQCYLCDRCYMNKCPYVPPHEWHIDFPHLMLQAKAIQFKQHTRLRDRLLSATDLVGQFAGIPIVTQCINIANRNPIIRRLMHTLMGIHRQAKLPRYANLRQRLAIRSVSSSPLTVQATPNTHGKVVIFPTCYGRYHMPQLVEDLVIILQHNQIEVTVLPQTQCCGMPKFELGDFDHIAKTMRHNIDLLLPWVEQGWDITAPVPSCVLMFKQELPLLFIDDDTVQQVRDAWFDPFEYLYLRHQAGLFHTDFKHTLGQVFYHAACHLQVQNFGLRTRDILALIPNTQLTAVTRCSGHDGTYGVKSESHAVSMKICQPLHQAINQYPHTFTSDCPIAGLQLSNGVTHPHDYQHPLSLLRYAYAL
ncbi:MAG: Fe-S oxidoreductase [Legionellales bacterium]|nr:Fe-S oxidoreductase [Legionellales bacterium]